MSTLINCSCIPGKIISPLTKIASVSQWKHKWSRSQVLFLIWSDISENESVQSRKFNHRQNQYFASKASMIPCPVPTSLFRGGLCWVIQCSFYRIWFWITDHVKKLAILKRPIWSSNCAKCTPEHLYFQNFSPQPAVARRVAAETRVCKSLGSQSFRGWHLCRCENEIKQMPSSRYIYWKTAAEVYPFERHHYSTSRPLATDGEQPVQGDSESAKIVSRPKVILVAPV